MAEAEEEPEQGSSLFFTYETVSKNQGKKVHGSAEKKGGGESRMNYLLQSGQSMERLKMFAIGFVVIGVTVTVGLDITSSVKDNIVVDRTVDNETFNVTSNQYEYTVTEAGDADFLTLTSATAYNTTTQSTQLTVSIIGDGTSGKVFVNGSAGNTDLQSIDYRYEDKDTDARQGASDAISGLTELSGFLPIIGLVVAAAVVIGLVSTGFGSSSGRRGRA